MNEVMTVTQVNSYIKSLFGNDEVMKSAIVSGEISNINFHSSGHIYLTLKDEKSVLKGIFFKGSQASLKFRPENGMKVICRGYISIYEAAGQYQLYIYNMQPDGVGNLQMAYEQLKEKLAGEGLFDNKFKKELPAFPNTIAVVTSPTGAAVRDVINIATRRMPMTKVLVIPVLVQGDGSAESIVRAIEAINNKKLADVIIVGRGGGSLEDLWSFNEEIVARAIFKSEIPVISAVGHEIDFTIADFVADVRAPTPSAAAELALPDRLTILKEIGSLRQRLLKNITVNFELKKEKWLRVSQKLSSRSLIDNINQKRMKLDSLEKSMQTVVNMKLEAEKNRLLMVLSKMETLSHKSTLSRGYAMLREDVSKKVVKSVKDIDVNDKIEVMLNDGTLSCTVDSIEM